MCELLMSRFETYLLDEEVEMETEASRLEKREEYMPSEQPQYPQGFFSGL